MKYPGGSAEGKKQFRTLEERAKKNLYDDEFLLLLIEYQRMHPQSEHFDIFYARYAAFHGNYRVALEHAKKAYACRKQDAETWKLLAGIYERIGDKYHAALYLGLVSLDNEKTLMDITGKESVAGLEMAHTSPALAPFKQSAVFVGNAIKFQDGLFLGEQLPMEENGKEGYWVGIYNMDGRREARTFLLDRIKEFHLPMSNYCDMTFDCLRATLKKTMEVSLKQEEKCILPLSGTEHFQKIRIQEEGGACHHAVLAKCETMFLRLESPAHITSDIPFAVGNPVLLAHSPERKKVVLNILADGLSWAEQKKEGFANIPNILRFFGKGIIFNQNFSETEYTYPSLAAIETGMRTAHSQIFHDGRYVSLEPSILTISEQMGKLGYYCVNVQGNGEGIYNGVTRGHERVLVNHYHHPAYVGVERTIRQLEAFSETDQFIFLHMTDSHPYNSDMNILEDAQTHLSLKEHLQNIDRSTSVCVAANQRNQWVNRKRIRNMDRQLGSLFRYIEDHYKENEYIVHLYSDHGCSVYSEQPWLMDEYQTSSALMMRGDGIPHLGFVEELTSVWDIYKIVGHNCHYPVDGTHLDGNLPEVLGGKRREYVWSNSIYPGQTYKLCLRTETHEFRLETEHLTRENGTVKLHPYRTRLFLRNGEHTEIREEGTEKMFMKWILEDRYHIFCDELPKGS